MIEMLISLSARQLSIVRGASFVATFVALSRFWELPPGWEAFVWWVVEAGAVQDFLARRLKGSGTLELTFEMKGSRLLGIKDFKVHHKDQHP